MVRVLFRARSTSDADGDSHTLRIFSLTLLSPIFLLMLIACSDGDGQEPLAGTDGIPIAQSSPASGVEAPLSPNGPRYGGNLRIAQPGDPVSCDIAMSRGVGYQSVHPCNPMLSQIVRSSSNDHSAIAPDLAETWSVSADGRTWTFKLRPDARWHDGSAVTASDLKFSIDRVIEPPEGLFAGRAAPIAGYVSSTNQVAAISDDTLTITTDFPAASFITNLANVYVSVFPKAITEQLDPPSMVLHENVIGSGPFKFSSATRGSFYEMVKNADYYEPDLPYLDSITFLVIPSPAVRVAAMQTGEADIVMLLTEPEAESIASDSDRIRLIRQPSAGGNTVQMNLAKAPFDDPRVRRAVNLAFSRSDAVLALGGGFDGAIMPPGGPWALDPTEVSQLPGYGDDVSERSRARELLTNAGYPDGLSVQMHSRSDPFSTSLAEFAVAQLSEVGIDVDLIPLERTAYAELVANGEHTLISHSHSFSLDDPDAILPAHYSCGGAENFPGLCDAEIDRLIEMQSRETDPDARKELVDEIQRRVWATDAKIWFNWSVRRTPVSVKVRNFDPGGPSLYQGRRFESVWLAE